MSMVEALELSPPDWAVGTGLLAQAVLSRDWETAQATAKAGLPLGQLCGADSPASGQGVALQYQARPPANCRLHVSLPQQHWRRGKLAPSQQELSRPDMQVGMPSIEDVVSAGLDHKFATAGLQPAGVSGKEHPRAFLRAVGSSAAPASAALAPLVPRLQLSMCRWACPASRTSSLRAWTTSLQEQCRGQLA